MIFLFSYTCTVHRLFGGKFKAIMVLVVCTPNSYQVPTLLASEVMYVSKQRKNYKQNRFVSSKSPLGFLLKSTDHIIIQLSQSIKSILMIHSQKVCYNLLIIQKRTSQDISEAYSPFIRQQAIQFLSILARPCTTYIQDFLCETPQ